MDKKLFIGLLMGLFIFSIVGLANAIPVTLVNQGSPWEYSVLSYDLYPNWSNINYNSFNWRTANWRWGKAAFSNGNGYLPYSTYWKENTDLALQKTFYINGNLKEPVILNMAIDNGVVVFINGQMVAKEMAEGYTYYWEYSLPLTTLSFISPGVNIIQVLAEDHGGLTFFDLKLTGNVTSAPEPLTILLLCTGLVSLIGIQLKTNNLLRL